MNHEPECNVLLMDEFERPRFGRIPPTFKMPPGTGWCNCDAIRAAYQRGREDAAETVRIAAYELLMKNVGKGITWEQMADMAIAAARGHAKPITVKMHPIHDLDCYGIPCVCQDCECRKSDK